MDEVLITEKQSCLTINKPIVVGKPFIWNLKSRPNETSNKPQIINRRIGYK